MSEFNNLTAARFAEMERQLESYQACRVRDVDEKAWLSKRMTKFESVLREIADGGWSEVIEPVALARAALTEASEGVEP